MAIITYNETNNSINIEGVGPFFNRSLIAEEAFPEDVEDQQITIRIDDEAHKYQICEDYDQFLNGNDSNNPFGVDLASTITALNSFLNHDETDFYNHISP